MRTHDHSFLGRAALVLAATILVSVTAAGRQTPAMPPTHQMGADSMHSMKPMTTAQKIATAMTAAPASIAAKATVLDWPAKEGEQPAVLRAGTNGWTCLPDMPDTKGNDPMCLDQPWMKWVDAYMSKKAPDIGHVGIGYMMAPGGAWGSNTDPYAVAESADNHWGHHNPHVMIVVPDVKTLVGISTDPDNGGPYVMYAGTPYAHIMAPTTDAAMSGKSR